MSQERLFDGQLVSEIAGRLNLVIFQRKKRGECKGNIDI